MIDSSSSKATYSPLACVDEEQLTACWRVPHNLETGAISYLPLLLGVRSQAEKHLSSLGERFGSEFFIGVLSEVAADEGIDGLTILTGVDFNTPVSCS